jgi:hypothetical protein
VRAVFGRARGIIEKPSLVPTACEAQTRTAIREFRLGAAVCPPSIGSKPYVQCLPFLGELSLTSVNDDLDKYQYWIAGRREDDNWSLRRSVMMILPL